MIRPGMTQAAPWHAKDHWYRCAPPIMNFRRIVDELVESGGHEIVELNLADRSHSGERRSDTDADRRALRQNRVDDAVAELAEERPQQQKRIAVLAADILAVHERARIVSQRVADAEHH